MSKDTTYHNIGIQYIVPLDSITLYMQVTSINSDTFHLQFDTASFLSSTGLRYDNGGKTERMSRQSAVSSESKIKYYDIMGRAIPSNEILKRGSLVSARIIMSGNKVLLRFYQPH